MWSYELKGALTDGFDITISSMRALFPGVRLGYCLRHALNKLPSKLIGVSAPVRRDYARSSTPCSTDVVSGKACGWWHWASACATLPITSPRRWEKRMARAFAIGSRTSCAVKSARRNVAIPWDVQASHEPLGISGAGHLAG